jgi:hypothetical protein
LALEFAQLRELAVMSRVLSILLLLTLLFSLLFRLWPVYYLAGGSYNFIRVDHVMLGL